ncbi:hypothetical protein HORIV_46800 [Vreelandella olivaria]|uniref:Uncharacterized protein n=1 Tax=Vreelandella olivaria TaxID=390919 RepID=A0ABM7GNM7_9GAMM|nr:hypothetical protein HORIV_46800 [Halomonas olivaria]
MQSIHQETKKLEELEKNKRGIDEKLVDVVSRLSKRKESATNSVWEIKLAILVVIVS